MEKKSKLDEIQSRLQISDLDKDAKKDLFSKFQNVGGKVVNLETNAQNDLSQQSTSAKNTKVGDHSIRSAQGMVNPFSVSTTTNNKKNNDSDSLQVSSKNDSIFKVFLVRLSGFFANLFNFSATKFSSKFKDLSLEKVYTEFTSLQAFLGPIFQKVTIQSVDFKDFAIEQNFLEEYELAYYSYHLFDIQWFEGLENTMNISVDYSEKYFKLIFRQLMIFYMYHMRMQLAVNHVIKKHEQHFNQKIHPRYTSKKIDAIFATIWQEWYLFVEELTQYYWVRSNNKTFFKSLEIFLEISPEMKPQIGQLSIKWRNQYETKKIEEQLEVEKLDVVFPSPEIEKGVMFINTHINFSEYMEQFKSTKDSRAFFSSTEQLFYAYVLIDYFDKEYTYIWNDINFHVVPGGDTGRFDAKREIKTFTNKLQQFYELVNEYLKFARSNRQLKDITGNTEINEIKEKEISRNSFNVRQQLLEILESYVSVLEKIINSRNTENEIVGNGSEKLVIGKNRDHKILYEKTVKEIINLAYEYVLAVVWLLKHSDLSGLSGHAHHMDILSNHLLDNVE